MILLLLLSCCLFTLVSSRVCYAGMISECYSTKAFDIPLPPLNITLSDCHEIYYETINVTVSGTTQKSGVLVTDLLPYDPLKDTYFCNSETAKRTYNVSLYVGANYVPTADTNNGSLYIPIFSESVSTIQEAVEKIIDLNLLISVNVPPPVIYYNLLKYSFPINETRCYFKLTLYSCLERYSFMRLIAAIIGLSVGTFLIVLCVVISTIICIIYCFEVFCGKFEQGLEFIENNDITLIEEETKT